jgi:hypothetical protein
MNINIIIEIRIHNDDTSFVNRLSEINRVKDAVLVSYNGDYVS